MVASVTNLSGAAGMNSALRKSGLEIIGDVPWGTHLCQFYKTREDLLRLLVPYFKAGLENNEFCMWVTSGPLMVEDAENALREAVVDFDAFKRSGQVEIVPHTEWYMKDGYFDLERVFDGWKAKLAGALERGFEGLRATGNTAWLEEADWASFTEYEEELNRIIGDFQMMAICTYSLDKCSASEVIDVVSNHQYALIEREGEWELIESGERRKAREALLQSEERYQRVVENIQDAILITDTRFNITGWNRAAEEIYGYAAAEVIGRQVGQLLQTSYEGTTREEALAQLAEDSYYRCEVSQRHEDGSLVRIESIVIPLKDAEGTIDGFVAVNRDITKRKKVEEAFRALSDELLKANRELDDYARAVSHDLRGPLAAASLANELLRDELGHPDLEHLRAEVEESTIMIERNIGKCHDLVNDLLALAEAGQKPIRVAEVDVSGIVREILDVHDISLREKGFSVLVDDDLGRIHANETQIYQLFSNLIVNAILHNDSGEPALEVRRLGRGDDGSHHYVVSDNGSGLPIEHDDEIFKPFFKKGPGSDTGIGLSIVRKVVEAYGGSIEAYNRDGAYFEFSIYDA